MNREVMLVVPSWQLVVAARGNWGGVRLEKTSLLAEAILPKLGSYLKRHPEFNLLVRGCIQRRLL